ncbi:MAG: hypothetical protein WAW02_03690 [Sideroxyarcus sp.]
MNLQAAGNSTRETNISSLASGWKWTDTHASELNDLPALSLDERGMILDCNKQFEKQTGFEWHDLVWNHITRVFPQLTAVDFIQAGQTCPLPDYLIRCSQLYQAQKRDGATFLSNLIFIRHEHEGKPSLRLFVCPAKDATT